MVEFVGFDLISAIEVLYAASKKIKVLKLEEALELIGKDEEDAISYVFDIVIGELGDKSITACPENEFKYPNYWANQSS